MQLTSRNSAWSISPDASSGARTTPAARPKCAAVASEPRPQSEPVGRGGEAAARGARRQPGLPQVVLVAGLVVEHGEVPVRTPRPGGAP